MPYPHLFYLVIVISASFGSWFTTITIALLSSFLMSGWIMPLSVPDKIVQNHFSWIFRSLMYISISVFTKISINAVRNKNTMIDNKVQQLLLFQQSALKGILSLAETRDPETTGMHLERLIYYAEVLLNKFDVPKQIKDNIINTMALHDIGKVAIPDYILLKPSKLTEEEFEIIKKHSIIGGKILEDIERSISKDEPELRKILKTAREIAYFHHERPDGKGYPLGLTGPDIPFSAKIASLCDVYDALTSERPYKKPFSHEECLEIIKAGKGTQFDEEVVEKFLEVSDEFKSIALKCNDKKIVRMEQSQHAVFERR